MKQELEFNVYEVTDGGPRHGQWCRAWRTPQMPAPAFYYYPTQAEAQGLVHQKCEQCARHDEAAELGGLYLEVFTWNNYNYSLDVARAILKRLPREPILFTRENAIGCGLPIESGLDTSNSRWVIDDHINHIPAEKFLEPGILAPAVRQADRPGLTPLAAWILLDGGHRLTALFRAGAPDALVYPLTILESLYCLGLDEAQAEAYVIRNRQAFLHFSDPELELAGIRFALPGERQGTKLG